MNNIPDLSQSFQWVSPDDLPLVCPAKHEKALWSLHPRVYLPIDNLGEVDCPYCGTHYILAHEPL